jgi:tRNA (guanine37-N1)-methyltransferase
MRITVVTLFPEAFESALAASLLGKARAAGLLTVDFVNPRDFTSDRHRSVDDAPYGGGPGMVMKPEPFFAAVQHIRRTRGEPAAVVLTTPDGPRMTHRDVERLSALPHVVLLCGRYEGVDDRVRRHVATEELSIGDYVLSGGELPALVIADAVARLIPGVVGDEASVTRDSFARGILDFPQYTRPAVFEGHDVPPVLLSGHHAEIEKWRRREALARTLERRPDLLEAATLDSEDRALLTELEERRQKGAS